MKIVQILIKVPPVNSEVLVDLKNINTPGWVCRGWRFHLTSVDTMFFDNYNLSSILPILVNFEHSNPWHKQKFSH